MQIVVRADASIKIGTGHVMRCSTLADGLSERGGEVVFVCREHAGNLCDFIEEKGYRVFRLSESSGKSAPLNWNPHAKWLGAPWAQDAKETVNAIQALGGHIDWLIVDHYALDQNWEYLLRHVVNKIMVIDDLADRFHDCDLLLDQNLYPDMETRYDNFLVNDCKQLFGPDYALLRPEFQKQKQHLRERNDKVENILVFMGGADSTNETVKVLHALRNDVFIDKQIVVVLGSSSPFRDATETICNEMKNVKLHFRVNNMAELMAWADLAIGGGGVTSWERCALKLPAIVIALADNQIEIAKTLGEQGAVVYLGQNKDVSSEDIRLAVKKIIDHPESLITMSERAGSLVDGHGVSRVVDYLLED